MARGGAVFLRRREGSRRLVVELRRVAEGSSVYPLDVTVTVPSAGGGVVERLSVPANGPATQRFTVGLPADLGAAAAVDLLLEADRVGVEPGGTVPWSVVVVRVAQES
jgi:hypothetical protein